MSYVFLLGKEGEDHHHDAIAVDSDWIKKELGISELQYRQNTLEDKINEIDDLLMFLVLVPHERQRLLDWLKDHPDTRSSKIRKLEINRLKKAWNIAFEQLHKEGKIISTSHGRGRERTWRVKE